MKKFLKAISMITAMFVLLLSMASCSGYSFYKDFKEAGASIEEENIFIEISLEDAKTKKAAGETFVLLYGNSSNSECVTVVTTLQVQAEYLGNPTALVYFLNSKDYKTSSDRKTVREAINMHDPSSDGAPIVMTFRATAVDVDTSNKDKVKTKQFIKDGVVQYASLSSYIFKDLLK